MTPATAGASPATAWVSGNRDARDVLVVVFLRGGADGLNLVVPHGDDDYYRARPTIGIPRDDLVDLDGFFGLNPQLRPLEPLWNEGHLAITHAVGSEDTTRSHFAAQDLMERGGDAAGGWLGRFLRADPAAADSPLAAVAIGPTLPESLRGAPGAAAITSVEDFTIGAKTDAFAAQLDTLYAGVGGAIGRAGAAAMTALDRIESLVAASRETTNPSGTDPGYGDDGFSRGLREVARLVKGRIGLRAACVDLGGWDSHLTQDAVINPPLARLGAGLAAFAKDLGDDFARTTVVVMTEFGRRVAENTALGTDHGRGSCLFVLGGGSIPGGGAVRADWPGLAPDRLVGPGDLPVVHHYRDILMPVLAAHVPGIDPGAVFPAPLTGLEVAGAAS